MASPNILGIGEDDREPLGGGGILEIRQPDPAVTTPAQALGQLYTNVTDEIRRQRQISADRGLWDESTGLPTGKGLLDVARQYGSGLQPATIAGIRAATANLSALEQAKRMSLKGVGRDDILSETGWWRGPDNQWRFEISDQGATVNQGVGSGARLDAVLNHPELHAAYPELAKVSVQTQPGRGGFYRVGDGDPLISVNEKLPKGPLLHETQHAIQDIEGFERGGSIMGSTARPEFQEAMQKRIKSVTTPLSYEEYANLAWDGEKSAASLADYNNSYLKTVPKSVDLYSDLGKTIQQEAAREVYMRLHGEVEARAVESRMNHDAQSRRDAGPWWSYDIPESQHIVRSPR